MPIAARTVARHSANARSAAELPGGQAAFFAMAETRSPPGSPPAVLAPGSEAHEGPPAVRSASDAAVLSRAQAGDPEAFRVLFEAHAPAVRRFLGDLLRDPSRADEATQETFVRAHARLGSLREAERLAGWLFGIARLVSMEQRRASRREAPMDDTGNDRGGERDTAPNPEAALLSGEAERVLDGALATLAEERRAALVLRLDHGLAYGDIAEAMGWPLQKVKNEIHRARLQLREQLKGYLEGES
jgi:RNA polymerase sigma-70 factor (ECF subfamily)